MAEIFRLGDVYVPVGTPSVTFVTRPYLERSVRSWEINKAKHLLIFGPSKIGKTSLWKRYLPESSVIKVPCNANTDLKEIYNQILHELNAFYTSEKAEGIESKVTLASEIKATLMGLLSGKGSLGAELSGTSDKKHVPVSNPVIGPNLLIKFLKPSGKIVVLEDFHYCEEELKQLLAQDLKAFSDEKSPWIIVGIQHKTSELLSYNFDLQQRIAEIPVESFSSDDLMQIIELGELALNIEFSTEIKRKIIGESFGSASIVQNICERICLIENINETQVEPVALTNVAVVTQACQEIANEHKTYYEKVIARVALGGRSDGSTDKYKWFLKLIKEVDIPEQGLKNTEMLRLMREMGHPHIEQGSVTSGLGYLPRLLAKEGFPSFFDYSQTNNTFYLLDKYMKFVFKWLPELVDNLFVVSPEDIEV